MAALCLLLAAACGFDYSRGKIPNSLTVAMALIGMAFRFREEQAWGIALYLGQAAAVMAPLYLLFRIGALGAGDVKLLGAAAGYLPFEKIFFFSFVSLLIAAMISLFKLLADQSFRERLGILAGYLARVRREGALLPYPAPGRGSCKTGVCKNSVCLSGPVLISLLLSLGGVY